METSTALKSIYTGETETLKQYGVVMTEVNLQEYAAEKGIKKKISAMTQAEKVQLRYNYVMEQTNLAAGDFAKTSNSWANQTRILSEQFKELLSILGSGLITVLTPVIKFLNNVLSMLIAIAKQVGAILSKLFGITVPTVQMGKLAQDMTDAAAGAGDLADGIEEAGKAANEALVPFDKLNVLSQDKGGGKPSGGFEMPEIEFEETDSAVGAINDTAEKLEETLAHIFNPFKESWEREGQFVIESWKYALSEISKLLSRIGKDFLRVWDSPETVAMLSNMLHIVGDIGLAAGHLAKNFREAWEENDTGYKILCNIRDIYWAIVKNIRSAADYTVRWAETLDFRPLLNSIEKWTESLISLYDTLSGALSDFYTQVLLPLGKWTLETGLPDLLDIATDLNNSVDWDKLRKSLQGLNKELLKITKFVFKSAIDFVKKFLSPIAKWTMNRALPTLVETVAELSEGIKWRLLNENLQKFWEGLSKFAVGIGEGLVLFFKSVSPFLTSTLAAVINGIGEALGALGDALNAIPAEAVQMIGGAIGGVLAVFAADKAIAAAITGISVALEGLSGAFALLAANPLTTLAAGIAAVAGSLIALEESWIEGENSLWETEQIEQYGETLDQINDKYKELGDRIAQNSQERIDHVNSVSAAEVPYLETLADKYFALAEKTDLSAQEYGELKLAAQELVDNFPQLQQYYDETTGLIDVERGAIEKLIETKKQELTLNAISEEWSNAIKDQVEAQKALDDASKNLNGALAEQEQALVPIEDALRRNSNANLSEFQPAYAEATEKVETFTAAVQEAQSALDEASGELSYYENAYGAAMEQLQTNAGDYGKTVADSFTGTLTSELEAAQPEVQTAVDGLLSEENIDVDTAPIGTNAVDGIVTTIEGSDLATPITDKMNEMSDAATDALGGVPSTVFGDIGEGAVAGITDAIDDNFNSPISRLRDLAEEMKAVFNGIDSDFYNTGVNVMRRLIDGLKSMESSLYSTIQSIADNIAQSIQGALTVGTTMGTAYRSGGVAFSPYTLQGINFTGEIPRLADGAVIRGGDPFVAVLGDQRHGQTNIEAPLATIKKANKETLMEVFSKMSMRSNTGGDIVVNIDGREVFRATQKQAQEYFDRTGRPAFPI